MDHIFKACICLACLATPCVQAQRIHEAHWEFDSLADWVDDSQNNSPQNYRIEEGKLRMWTRAQTRDRVKVRSAKRFSAGWYAWRVFAPPMGPGDQASIGAFLYRDDKHELDFEIGFGTAKLRKELAATSDDLVCYCTTQGHPYSSTQVLVKSGQWHSLVLELAPGPDKCYLARWLINGSLMKELQTSISQDISFTIHCSVENLTFIGDHIPQQQNHALFDYVSFGSPRAVSQDAVSQAAEKVSNLGAIVRYDECMNELIALDAEIEVLASGFAWSEGPLWIEDGDYLLFSDIPRNAVMKWQEGTGISLFMKPSGYTGVADYGRESGSNGLALDQQARIIFCEHGDRRVSRLEEGGGKRTLVDSYKGRRLNSPNDAVVKSDGSIYFTDPPYGLPQRFADPKRELDFCGVYRLSPSGALTLLTKEMTRPNGIALSPDETVLYVAQSDSQHAIIKAFPVQADGSLGQGEVLCDFTSLVRRYPGSPDGLKVDQHGNLFATSPGGVHVITATGKILGRIHTGKPTANCAWGNDGSVLYMTVDDCLCRIKTRTRGANWGTGVAQ
jgi:gluconolactonase